MTIIEFIAGSETVKTALAGASGGIVRSLTLKQRVRDSLASAIVGALSAIYLGPVAVDLVSQWFGIELTGDTSLAGFLTGLLGITFTGFLIDTARKHRNAVESQRQQLAAPAVHTGAGDGV